MTADAARWLTGMETMNGAPLTGPGQRSLPQPRASLAAKVAALRQPAVWPVPPASVEVIETHMSWVFLTPQQVFKLKKPMRPDGLDFADLERRRFFCGEEVRLNRRLAPSVYLDVLPLRAAANGALGLWPEGEVVDWLVVMRRLPAGRMLDRLLATGAAQAGDMRQLAALLSAFYARLPPVLHDPEVYGERLAREIAHHEARLCDPQLPSSNPRSSCGLKASSRCRATATPKSREAYSANSARRECSMTILSSLPRRGRTAP